MSPNMSLPNMSSTIISNTTPSCKPLTISFLDLPVEIRYKIYHDLCRGRQNWPTNLCLLSPAWKSPQPPAALMNTCGLVASELMPIYFGQCLFVLDTTQNNSLRADALQWLNKVGERSSAHFRRVRVKHNIVSGYDYEIELTVTDNSEVTVKELNGGIESQSVYLVHRNHIDHCNQLGVTMIEDIETLLTERIKSRGFGALGAAEFEHILERIDLLMSWLRKVYEKRHSNNRRNDFLS